MTSLPKNKRVESCFGSSVELSRTVQAPILVKSGKYIDSSLICSYLRSGRSLKPGLTDHRMLAMCPKERSSLVLISRAGGFEFLLLF